MDLQENKITSKDLYGFDSFTLKEDKVLLPNGLEKKRTYINHPGGVGILALSADNKIVMVQQYRYPIEAITWEIPAGKMDKIQGESFLSAAKRELREETGLIAKDYFNIGHIFPSPGLLDERLELYVARGLSEVERDLDDDEFINIKWLEMDIFIDMVRKGEICDSKTITAFQLASINGLL